MVVLTTRKGKDAQSKKNNNCFDILQSLFLRCLRSSSPLDEGVTELMGDLHRPILDELHDTETREMESSSPVHPSEWPETLHKLFVFHMTYKVAAMPGNEGLWQSLRDPDEKATRTKETMRRCTDHMHTKKLTRSLLFALTPRCKTIDLDRLHLGTLSCLRNVDWCGKSTEEERNLDFLGTSLERFVSEEFPLDVLLLMEGEEWDERLLVWKRLRAAKEHAGKWTRVVSTLPDRFKRYVKFFLLSLIRHEQFSATYVLPPSDKCHIKCTRRLEVNATDESGRVSSKTTVTFCNFCKECLTYVDMGRRPPSFGHYLNVDTMKQFCHRDDSDRLHLISCMRDEPYVNLQFGHPDREQFGVCQGRRVCLELVGYPDKLCAFCFHDSLTELDIHTGTCLTEQENDEPCTGCRHMLNDDPTIKHRLLDLIEEEKKQRQVERVQLEEKIVEDKKKKWEIHKRKMFYLMDEAMKRKQRNKLIK